MSVRRMSAPTCQFLLIGVVAPIRPCVVLEVVPRTRSRSASSVVLASRSLSRVASSAWVGSWKNSALPSISSGVLRRSNSTLTTELSSICQVPCSEAMFSPLIASS